MKSIIFHPEKCIGCRICEVGCAVEHGSEINPLMSRIRVLRDDRRGIDAVGFCVGCEEAPCIDACPVNAISKDEKLGIVIVDDDLCISCGKCTEVCPYHGIFLDIKTKKAVSCDLCGGDPLCVKWCPTHALEYTSVSKEEKEKVIVEHKEILKIINKVKEG